MLRIPYLDLNRSTRHDLLETQKAIGQVLESGWFILGSEVADFEQEWATYCGATWCVGTGNGLDGLEIALASLNLPERSEVIVPSNTYIASWLAVTNNGLRVRPVEPDPETHNLTAKAVAASITSRTSAVLGVHLFGQLADENICAVAAQAGVPVIFDAAQAHGARISSSKTSGSIGDVSVHSFYPTKNLGALGDAGAITTDNDSIYGSARLRRNYGSKRKYENDIKGRNSRLDEIQAAILRVRLSDLDRLNRRRRHIAETYNAEFKALERVSPPAAPAHAEQHVWHAYNVICDSAESRDRLASDLASRGVGTQIFYPIPPHLSSAYEDHGWARGQFPIAESFADRSLALPIAPYLSDSEVAHVVASVTSSATQ